MSVTPTLTPREHAFVVAYLETHNATQAYIKAGYSPKGANANAARLIAKDSVSAAIQAGLAETKKRHIKTVDDVVDELSRLAFIGLDRFVRIDEDGQPTVDMSACTQDDLRLLSEITVKTWMEGPKDGPQKKVTETKLKLNDRVRTLEMLGKHLGVFKEGPNKVPPNPLADALRELLARGSALPVRIMGPLGSGRPPMRIVNPERGLDGAK
jgi:phage terminase small subunit